ncbi:XRE family transcriptional regulator, partial [bacterium]|nr:XRE family transcriptional regulator [bacterium]
SARGSCRLQEGSTESFRHLDIRPIAQVAALAHNRRMTTTAPTWTLCERMAKARRFAGITQIEMAEQLGVNPATINRWEKGTSRVTRADVIAWALTRRLPRLLLSGISGQPDGQSHHAQHH